MLVIVMISLLFTTFALIAFMERASNDLLVDQRDALNRRLRAEAYSALEVTLSVLEVFRGVGNGLRSPSEGWGDPLAFAGYEPGEGRTVRIEFEDESGKISLPHVNSNVLTYLFTSWQLPQSDAEMLADALMGWMSRSHVLSTALSPQYDLGAIPYEPPGRPMRSYHELAAIEYAREKFYDQDGRPNELWRRFADNVSLLDFQQPNLNGAKPDSLAVLGQFDEVQRQNLGDYLAGRGIHESQGPAFFQNPTDAQRIAGPSGNTGAFSTTISALRIIVTVMEGQTPFRLAAVIAPPGGATTVDTNATATRTQASSAKQPRSGRQARADKAATASLGKGGQPQGDQNLKYPFTLLEIRENDAISP
ncbi:MAG: hypothetical protein WD941_07175 [Opitutus sp.]